MSGVTILEHEEMRDTEIVRTWLKGVPEAHRHFRRHPCEEATSYCGCHVNLKLVSCLPESGWHETQLYIQMVVQTDIQSSALALAHPMLSQSVLLHVVKNLS